MTEISFTFVQPDGTEQPVTIEPGTTLMEAALFNGVDGIQGLCGGICSCATCHVALDPELFAVLPAPSEGEAEMLDILDNHQPTSRLGCQVQATPELAGARVRVLMEE